MSFKSQKEMMEYVIQEKPVRHKSWSEKSYVKMKDGFTYNEESFRVDLSFSAPQDFEIYQEPKPKRKITLYRYTYDDHGVIQQSWWIACSFEKYRSGIAGKLLVTESKEIEVDA